MVLQYPSGLYKGTVPKAFPQRGDDDPSGGRGMNEFDLIILHGHDHSYMVDSFGAPACTEKEEVSFGHIFDFHPPAFLCHMVGSSWQFYIVLAKRYVEEARAVHSLFGRTSKFITCTGKLECGIDDIIGL